MWVQLSVQSSLWCSGVIGTFQSATFKLNKINVLVINDQLGLLHTFPHVRPQVLLTLMPPSLQPFVSVGLTLRRLVLITLNKLRSCTTFNVAHILKYSVSHSFPPIGGRQRVLHTVSNAPNDPRWILLHSMLVFCVRCAKTHTQA